MDKIPTEKMDKTAVEMDKAAVGIEHGQETAVDNMQTEKMEKRPESDGPPARVNGKYRLPEDYVCFVLAMPTETPTDIYNDDDEDLSFITHRAKLMNCSDDWIEEQKKHYRERAALSKRITEQFVQFQDAMRDEWVNKGYVESDEDFEANLAATQEYSSQLWREYNPHLA